MSCYYRMFLLLVFFATLLGIILYQMHILQCHQNMTDQATKLIFTTTLFMVKMFNFRLVFNKSEQKKYEDLALSVSDIGT